MHTLYDTGTVAPLDRYDYYRTGAGREIAPVTVHGRRPGRMSAVMSVSRIGAFEIEAFTWSADSQVVSRRTEQLIRASDPECYRLILNVSARPRLEQAGNRVALAARDIGLFDLSYPVWSAQLPGRGVMRLVMVTFPRVLLPPGAGLRRLIGTALPRRLPGRDLVAQFLIGLTDVAEPAREPASAAVLQECTVGLIRQRLGLPNGITPTTRRLLHRTHIGHVIRRTLHDPGLDPTRIARAANMSPRYLHRLFQEVGETPMQLLKRLRLEECRRSLRDPVLGTTPVKDVIAAHGYVRQDQFARDFRRQFGVSATQVRALARATVR
ncbi:MAG TPA: AraC family transcriptional regulator [Pseudonocardiaceae bacterium]